MSMPGTGAEPLTLLRTKLYRPQVRTDWVHRPRLVKRLHHGPDRRVTLVSAPAGFGKSCLVASSLTDTDHHVAWLSLDKDDNDPVRFWSYAIAAVQSADPEIGGEAHQIISAPQLRRPDPAVVSLLNDITEHDHSLALVLDDYHAIDAAQIHESIAYLLDHQPSNLHLMLITRADPPLSLARLRAHGRLTEIRAQDLQFSAAEAAILFNGVLELGLTTEQVEALNHRAEGWIVGLQLAALSLKRHPSYEAFIEGFTGSHQFVLDYLTEEVLRTLPGALRGFLLRTSILGRFCGPLCTAVTGDPSSHQLLDELRKANLFLIPLDAGGRWFRYHHLFAELLHTLLERDHAEEIAELHHRAATWLANEAHAEDAIEHAICAGDTAQAHELVLRFWFPLLSRGEARTVLRWLYALPEEVQGDDPSVALATCWALYLSGQSQAIAPHLERANGAYERAVSQGGLTAEQLSSVAAQLSMLRSVLAGNRADRAGSVAHAEEAIRLVSPEDKDNAGTAWSILGDACAATGDYDRAVKAHERGAALMRAGGDLIGTFMAVFGQALYRINQGRLNEAGQVCRSALGRALRDGHGDYPAVAWLHIGLAKVELERYNLHQTQAHLDDALRVARGSGISGMLRSGRYFPAHLAAARGDLDTAVEIMEAAERVIVAMDDAYLTGELNREWARLYLRAGKVSAARERLHILAEMSAATEHADLRHAHDWMAARLACADGRHAEALAGLDEAIPRARASNSLGHLIRLLALRAVVLDSSGKPTQARSALREAVELGAPDGYVRRWLDAGPAVGPLLKDLRNRGDTPGEWHSYLYALLDACRSAFGHLPLQSAGGLLDPLTTRELDVMRLICAGYSNQAIADELVVALNTVKRHTTNIYSKLGVRSRTQAVSRVSELDIL